MTPVGLERPAGAVLVAVFAAPHGDGVDRVAVALNRAAATTWSSACRSRAPAWAGACLLDTATHPDAPERPLALADRCGSAPRS